MASVFLSYDREDIGHARPLAAALEKAGHKVWWDRHIKGGSRYAAEIEKALSAADAVVVLWSHESVQSDWVRDEAAKGRDSGRLVPARIDDVEPPLGFGQHQTTDLSRFKGRASSPQFRDLLEGIEGILTGERPARTSSGRTRPSARLSIGRAIGIAIAAALVLIGGYFAWNRFGGQPRMPTVAVAPANASPAASALAQDLLAKLGALQSSDAGAIRLADAADVKRADLLFKVNSSPQSKSNASLSLVAGKDGSILWSGTFEQPSGNVADLKQQVAFTAARILGCASEGLGAEGKGLELPTLKQYLNACAQLAEISSDGSTPVVPILLDVVKKAPRFEAAWAKLLVAEADAAKSDISGRIEAPEAARLRARIAEARKINPSMPAIANAEALLIPPREFGKRMALLDRAIRDAPDNMQLLATRSGALHSVGKLRESIADASIAAELDPLSPSRRDGLISALLYAGQTDVALQELRKAEQLWPGTKSVEQIQYRYHLRFGDPLVARRLAQGRDQGYLDLFLTARADPSSANVDRLTAYMWSRVRSGEAYPSNVSGLGLMMQGLGQFGRTDELFKLFAEWKSDQDLSVVSDLYFRPALRGFIRDPRFMSVAKRAGLIDYWRQSGKWPDFCFDPDQPYNCKAEAAKLVGKG